MAFGFLSKTLYVLRTLPTNVLTDVFKLNSLLCRQIKINTILTKAQELQPQHKSALHGPRVKKYLLMHQTANSPLSR